MIAGGWAGDWGDGRARRDLAVGHFGGSFRQAGAIEGCISETTPRVGGGNRIASCSTPAEGCSSELTPQVGVRFDGGAVSKRQQRRVAHRRLETAAPSDHSGWRQFGDASDGYPQRCKRKSLRPSTTQQFPEHSVAPPAKRVGSFRAMGATAGAVRRGLAGDRRPLSAGLRFGAARASPG